MGSVAITILINVVLRNSVTPSSPSLEAIVIDVDTTEGDKMKH